VDAAAARRAVDNDLLLPGKSWGGEGRGGSIVGESVSARGGRGGRSGEARGPGMAGGGGSREAFEKGIDEVGEDDVIADEVRDEEAGGALGGRGLANDSSRASRRRVLPGEEVAGGSGTLSGEGVAGGAENGGNPDAEGVWKERGERDEDGECLGKGQGDGEEEGGWGIDGGGQDEEEEEEDWASEWHENPGLYEAKRAEMHERRVQQEAQRKGLALAAVREKELQALDEAERTRRARVAGVEDGALEVHGASDTMRAEREQQREAEMYAMWPEVAGVCAKDKHPLDYKVPLERLVQLSHDASLMRKLAEADDAQFEEMAARMEADLLRQAPRHVRERVEKVKRTFGFLPGVTDEIEGFNSFRTSLPPPLRPLPAVKRGDLVIPDSFASVPEAVWASSDGHRLFVRAGNHTWLGVGRSGWSSTRPYDFEAVCRRDAPPAYAQALHGLVMVPPGPDSTPVVGDWMGEFVDPEIESFCLHVTGEPGARVCGRWLLKPNSVGSLSGIETVYQGNESAVHEADGALDALPYTGTIEVRGGPWLMDKCGLRACMAVALVCARQSLVKVRGCVVGGISHDRNRLSGAGRATMAVDCRDFARLVLQNSTAEMTGWDFMAALRATGKVLVSIVGCSFDRNIHSIGVFDHASIKVSSCVMRGNDQGAFVAYHRRRPVTANPPGEFFQPLVHQPEKDGLGKRDREGRVLASDSVAGGAGELAKHCGEGGHKEPTSEQQRRPQQPGAPGAFRAQVGRKKVVREGLGMHPYLQDEMLPDTRECGLGETVRHDPVFGNVTDGWQLGLPGWTDGVPTETVELVQMLVGKNAGSEQLRRVPPSWRRWGEVGCLTSTCIVNGSLPLNYDVPLNCNAAEPVIDILTPHFTGGSHHASLTADNCTVFGDVWGTDERPGSVMMVNVTAEPDAWIEKYMSEDSRINSSELLEWMGFQWDSRRGDWLKPLRRVDGSIAYALWHETRFAKDGARGGIPGCRQDYPMFDPATGRRILLNETLSPCDWEWHTYPGLDGYCERVAAPHARQRLLRLARVRGHLQSALICVLACSRALQRVAYRLSPLASRLSPIASRLSPLASRLSPIAHRLSPIAYRLSPAHPLSCASFCTCTSLSPPPSAATCHCFFASHA